ncbi:uncharacterized protein LOC126470014 [Schistocerca serialis cubense]|uniref:uncharacterized protein LOC126470014 n=1 Tax=Schistocerca serialis cubense TaxID=2023355 RepID=UPI00214EE879|nr:uncharacterized protein LOC126470014 [Schistocerca serialis cubense]
MTAVHRVMKKVNNDLVPTRKLFLTFDSVKLPSRIKAGYEVISARPYVPTPTRCYQCQRFNHTRQSCSNSAKCVTCGRDAHEGDCPPPSPRCVYCQGDHAASSRDCPVYKEERCIQEIWVKEKVSTSAARKLLASRKPTLLPAGKYSTVLASPRTTREEATQTCDLTFSTTVVRSASAKIARSTSPLPPITPQTPAPSSAPAKMKTQKSDARAFKKEPSRADFLRTSTSQPSTGTSTKRPSKKAHRKHSSPSPPRRISSPAPPSGCRPRPSSVSPGRTAGSRTSGRSLAEEAPPPGHLTKMADEPIEPMDDDCPPSDSGSSARSKPGLCGDPFFHLPFLLTRALIHWNIRSIRSNREDLKLLLRLHRPLVVALQETKLRPCDQIALAHYTSVRFDLPPVVGIPAHGGVMLLVRDDIYYDPIMLHTSLQAVAIRITLPTFTFSICTVYTPSSSAVTRADMIQLIAQLPAPFLLTGDFNAHHHLWGSPASCPRGSLLADLFNQLNLVCLSTGAPTFLSDTSHMLVPT